MEKTKKGDCIELLFSGYSNGTLFDTNFSKNKSNPIKIIIGEEMVIKPLDENLSDKEIGKEYEVNLGKAFGERKKELIKTIPLKSFTEHKINPHPGMAFDIDGKFVKIIAVSGARVIADFNNPLSGKEITYKFTITKKITDEKEKTKAVLDYFLKGEYEIKDKEIILKKEIPKLLKEKIEKLTNKTLKTKSSEN